jgi:type VI secretion system protein VasG
MSLAVALYAVVNHIVRTCNDPDSGGRTIDNIITKHAFAGAIPRIPEKISGKEEITQARVAIDNSGFVYAWT